MPLVLEKLCKSRGHNLQATFAMQLNFVCRAAPEKGHSFASEDNALSEVRIVEQQAELASPPIDSANEGDVMQEAGKPYKYLSQHSSTTYSLKSHPVIL